jgi:CPA2 family monovalent cation:H+ antiporter-2
LRETGIKYIIIEMNPDTVREEKDKGENIIYGDISREEVLINAGIINANVLVVAISDPATSRRVIKTARKLNKELYLLIRTRFVNETEDLTKLGADAVIPEEFETSLQIFRKVLEQYHIPLNVIMQQINLLRGESYKWMRTEKAEPQIFSHLDEILAVGITDTFYINKDNPNIGKTLSELNIRAVTGATIIAIVRKDKTISNPSASEILQQNDTLVITGTHNAVDKAYNFISGENMYN